MTCDIAVLRGDGIGPEVIESALCVLGACVPFGCARGPWGAPPSTRPAIPCRLPRSRCPRLRCRAARRGRADRSGKGPTRAGGGAAAAGRRLAFTRTCGPRATWACPRRCARVSRARPTSWSCASCRAASTSASRAASRRPRRSTPGARHARGRARGPRRLQARARAAHEGHLGRQGERARGLAPVAAAW